MNKHQFISKLKERRDMLKRHRVEWLEDGFLKTPVSESHSRNNKMAGKGNGNFYRGFSK